MRYSTFIRANWRIAFLAPIKRPITPQTTVSRNRVIADLATGLAERGHRVHLFTTKDSFLEGVEVTGIVPRGIQFLPPEENPFYQHTAYLAQMIQTVWSKQESFDLIHNHMYPEFLPLLAQTSLRVPMLTTVHAQMTEELSRTLSMFPDASLVAISKSAKKHAQSPMRVIYNSVRTDFFLPQEGEKEYLLFVGRMSKAKKEDGTFLDPKGVGDAIQAAKKAGKPLKIVGNVEDPEFFTTVVRPHLSDQITFVGEVSAEQKMSRREMRELFSGARALVNPVHWEEPFGLVMAEALSCGTPVIAYDRGSVAEIVQDGVTGFVIDPDRGVDGIAEAIGKVEGINRQRCRREAVDRFSTTAMVETYETAYAELLEENVTIYTQTRYENRSTAPITAYNTQVSEQNFRTQDAVSFAGERIG